MRKWQGKPVVRKDTGGKLTTGMTFTLDGRTTGEVGAEVAQPRLVESPDLKTEPKECKDAP